MSHFRRVLVANRGAISVRIQKTLACMGIPAAAVYSEADSAALHVLVAERAACIGPGPARESYLKAEALIDAAHSMHCDALHPGYGFLSENAAFAEQVRAAGLCFIGPSASAMRSMGDKSLARGIATQAGVACVPGFDAEADDRTLHAEAQRIGFPLLIKAAHGGGGKGMRAVHEAREFDAALAAARRESLAAFGRSEVLLERLVGRARHVEIQLLADQHGAVHAFAERECSLQRRHQKVLEESPSAAVNEELRARLQSAAVAIAKAVHYEGAGTIEFLLEPDGRFWFLEMNTRLQVEHGVTELVSGEDLVEWQVRIASGEHLPQELPSTARGHAMQVRLYAEDPAQGFLPQAGTLGQVRWPLGPGLRVDAGVVSGAVLSHYYDPMLAKLLAHGRDREQCRSRLQEALRCTQVSGATTNIEWLGRLVDHACVRAAQTYTHTLQDLQMPTKVAADGAVWAAAAALALRANATHSAESARPALPSECLNGFRLGGTQP